MITMYRLKNLLQDGALTGAQLDAMLADPAYLGALHDLCANKTWIHGCLRSATARAALFGSAEAVKTLFRFVYVKKRIWEHKETFDALVASTVARETLRTIAVSVAATTGGLTGYAYYPGRSLLVTIQNRHGQPSSWTLVGLDGACMPATNDSSATTNAYGADYLATSSVFKTFSKGIIRGGSSIAVEYIRMDVED